LSSWKPSFSELAQLSEKIVQEFATSEAGMNAKKHGDDWLAQSIYFIRDTLIFFVFEKYVSMADAGGVLRVFKFWSFAFRGAGLTNYARETLEVQLTWLYELPDDLKTCLEHAWFVNISGKSRHWIPSDLYLEHMNFYIKVFRFLFYFKKAI
jgi:hypothetical protein